MSGHLLCTVLIRQYMLISNILSLYAHLQFIRKLECGPMPNLLVALPNIGGALCSTPQSLADAHYYSAVQ